MTGRIKRLRTKGGFGLIAAENGLMFRFQPSTVPPDGEPVLAVGQSVTFDDVEDTRRPTAENVHVPPQVSSREKRPAGAFLQYLGFTHEGDTRVYRFKRIARGEEARELIVNVDLALLAKHHVALQEGPALSLHRLQLEEVDARCAPSPQSLTDGDMLAHLASRRNRQPQRPAAAVRPRPGRPEPGASGERPAW